MKVKIEGKEFELKRTLRSIILYEAIAKKPFNPKNSTDMIFYFYANILAVSKDSSITLDEFIDWLDENPGKLGEFSEWLIKVNDVEELTAKKKTTKKVSKKS